MGSAGGIAAQKLPGGATLRNETHGDWTVACRTVELAESEGNKSNGILVLAFGLRLDYSARLAMDETPPRDPRRFSTPPVGGLYPSPSIRPPASDRHTSRKEGAPA
ncbi:hypothetical protein [Hoeflea sp.]|uniref:hypothetical protein n=1 Tax=Hoeflea sp. TaxID=1940281 RepID=UPI00198E4F7C|nr:hypothetical protein [Hoeflea sp.]MBC7283267.1 hypothetical protein [Hoeflea sp.]